MKSPDIIEIILKVVRVFEKLKINYYVGGSLASSAFGIARTTLDADIVADIKFEHLSLLTESLKEEFYVDSQMILQALRQKSSFNLIHLETMFKVDIFILKDRSFDKHAFLRRIKRSISEDGTLELFFTTPEDIILNKLEWYKMGGGVSEHQWNDVLGVMKVQTTQLDLSYLEHWAKKLGISDLLRRALSDAGIL